MVKNLAKKSLVIRCPDRFSFEHTISSHGWSDLRPFSLSEDRSSLLYTFLDSNGERALTGKLIRKDKKIEVLFNGDTPGNDFLEKIVGDVRHILRLDEDFRQFYGLTEEDQNLRWVSVSNAGRLLRSPTVFEDLVKTICTTNCSWSLTTSMTSKLVDNLGTPDGTGQKAFPTAKMMAAQDEPFYRNEIRAGYRSSYLLELSENVASGKVDPEKWLDPDLPADEVKSQLKSIKGVGDYAAENMLKLLGRYDGLALDSWLRKQFFKKHNNDAACADSKIRSHYEKYGVWRGLAIWCDMTERWFD